MTETSRQTADESTLETFTTTPTTTMSTIWLTITAVIGIPLGIYFFAAKDLFGTEGFGEVAAIFVLLVTLIGIAKFTVQLFVLRRTKYSITEDAVRKEFTLLYRTKSRELPLSMLRSIEFRRGRLETLLGFGTVAFLTAGTNRSLGFLQFHYVDDADDVREIAQRRARLSRTGGRPTPPDGASGREQAVQAAQSTDGGRPSPGQSADSDTGKNA